MVRSQTQVPILESSQQLTISILLSKNPNIALNRRYGLLWFTDCTMNQSPVYEEMLARVLKGEKLLDLACGFGQNIRRLFIEGAGSDDLSGFDTISDLSRPGTISADRNHTRMTFFTGNLFDQFPNFELLDDKLDIVFASILFHLFD